MAIRCAGDFIHRAQGVVTKLEDGHVPLDPGISPMDNTDTLQEGTFIPTTGSTDLQTSMLYTKCVSQSRKIHFRDYLNLRTFQGAARKAAATRRCFQNLFPLDRERTTRKAM
jgi:hypothetical protein